MKKVYLSLTVLLLAATVLKAQGHTSSVVPTRIDFREESEETPEAEAPGDLPGTVPAAGASKWEATFSCGLSQFATPAFNNNKVHTRRNNSQFTGAFTLGYQVRPWLQAGVSVSYLKLGYQDDAAYDGSLPNTYNTVWLAEPMIPVQLYAKAFIGKETGFRSNFSVLAGYGAVSGNYIENAAGKKLTATPGTNGGLIAGVRVGLDYFFNPNFGVGATGTAQHIWMKSHGNARPGNVFPVTAGFRFRF